MPYTTSIRIDGPPQKAVTVLRDALIANAFTITEASQTEFTTISILTPLTPLHPPPRI